MSIHLTDNTITSWELNDRRELIREYLYEFAPQIFADECPLIYQAITEVFLRLPEDVFLQLTDRSYPVVFVEYHHSGLGRLANSTDVWNLPMDPPTFTKGFYLVKLNLELNSVSDPSEIEAIIAHELAHRVLGHGSREYSLELEREANRLIKKWGFEEEFLKAKERFQE